MVDIQKFLSEQQTVVDLAQVYSLGSKRLVFICGAGPSRDAGLPDWTALIGKLKAELGSPPLSLVEPEKLSDKISSIDAEINPWKKLSLIKNYMGGPNFSAAVRRLLSSKEKIVPSFYREVWKLKPHGLLTLNLDGFAARGFQELKTGERVSEVLGREAYKYTSVTQATSAFVVNLHGIIDNPSSWVLTEDDLAAISADEGYLNFLRMVFAQAIVVFYGLSVEDVGASGQLRYLNRIGFATNDIYWIKRAPISVNDFAIANSLGVRPIALPHEDQWSVGFSSLVKFLVDYRPHLPDAKPVLSETIGVPGPIPSVSELVRLEPDEIRKLLASASARFYNSNGDFSFGEFDKFCNEYDSAIHLAARVKVGSLNAQWLGYALESELGSGVFGRVYKGVGQRGDPVAIKIAREEVRDEEDMLHSFRRGVECMRILKRDKVPGTARIIDAAELPPSIVMEYIEGITLEDAVKTGVIRDALDKLAVIVRIAKIVSSCHDHSKHILHRDLRPSNVMLTGEWWEGFNSTDLVVLDFDLSWFEGAEHGDFVMKNAVALGYLAPEQLETGSGFSPRNSLVDVYGLAMLAFFMISQKHPGVYSVGENDWHKNIFEDFSSLSSARWRSARYRLARLIFSGSQRKQDERPNLRSFVTEVEVVLGALRGQGPDLQEYWIEEAFCRLFDRSYEWNVKAKSASVVLPSGIELSGFPIEGKGKLEFRLRFQTSAHTNRGSVGKYLSDRKGSVLDILKSIGAQDVELEIQRSALSGGWNISGVHDEEGLRKLIDGLKRISDGFRVN